MPHAHGPNWDRQQFPSGRVVLQGDYGPIAFRNVRVRDWSGDRRSVRSARKTSHAECPSGGIHVALQRQGFHRLEDVAPGQSRCGRSRMGFSSPTGSLEEWGADLETEREFQDFVLLADFRMPADSDSGILFRRLLPEHGILRAAGTDEPRNRASYGSARKSQFSPGKSEKRPSLRDAKRICHG